MRRSIPVGICTLRNVFCGFAAVGKGGARIGLSCLVIVNTKRGGATCPTRLPALSEETPLPAFRMIPRWFRFRRPAIGAANRPRALRAYSLRLSLSVRACPCRKLACVSTFKLKLDVRHLFGSQALLNLNDAQTEEVLPLNGYGRATR